MENVRAVRRTGKRFSGADGGQSPLITGSHRVVRTKSQNAKSLSQPPKRCRTARTAHDADAEGRGAHERVDDITRNKLCGARAGGSGRGRRELLPRTERKRERERSDDGRADGRGAAISRTSRRRRIRNGRSRARIAPRHRPRRRRRRAPFANLYGRGAYNNIITLMPLRRPRVRLLADMCVWIIIPGAIFLCARARY